MLVAFEDAEALERIRNRLTPLQRIEHSAAPRRKILVKLTRDFMREIGRLGGLKSRAVASHKKHISDVNRQNALKRWRKPEIQPAQKASPVNRSKSTFLAIALVSGRRKPMPGRSGASTLAYLISMQSTRIAESRSSSTLCTRPATR